MFFKQPVLDIIPWETIVNVTESYGGIAIHPDRYSTPWNFLMSVYPRIKSAKILMFYSPHDLNGLWGWDSTKDAITKGFLHQKRRLEMRSSPLQDNARLGSDGLFYQSSKACKRATGSSGVCIRIDDLKGNSTGGLADLAEAVNVKMNKTIMHGSVEMDKGDMLSIIRLEFEQLIHYAIDDARVLFEVREKFNDMVINQIAGPFLGMSLTDKDVKRTNGSLVAHVFHKWILEQHPDLPYAVAKLGRLSLGLCGPRMEKAQNDRDRALEYMRQFDSREDMPPEGKVALSRLLKVPMEHTVLREASSAILGQAETSKAFSALVQGGRAVNERPDKYTFGRGADIDEEGCYGSALRDYDYPIGIPSVIEYVQEQGQASVMSFSPWFVGRVWHDRAGQPRRRGSGNWLR
jgi:hypothetical protein